MMNRRTGKKLSMNDIHTWKVPRVAASRVATIMRKTKPGPSAENTNKPASYAMNGNEMASFFLK